MSTFDYLIVGAGFAGAVLAERLAADAGRKVLVIDKRRHIGGNAFDCYDEAGILVHRYGPHVFHTNSKEVYEYLSRFTLWRPYQHRALASVDGRLVPIPINLDTINELYGLSLSSSELQAWFTERAELVRHSPGHPRTAEEAVVSKVGRELYEKFFRGYTRKQWGLDPSALDASVTSRIPVRTNRDGRYFGDAYQVMPRHGYTRLFENLLDHKNIQLVLGCPWQEARAWVPHRQVIFTGPIDEFYAYRFGPLPYRSLRFEFETFETHGREFLQPCGQVNYPNDYLYTRVTEFKHLTGQSHARTTVAYEYSQAEGDPYYPIPMPRSATLYKQYQELARREEHVTFVGRLGTYRYYNMDQVVAQALATYRKIWRT